MKSKLTIRYDKIGDILYLDQCSPYPEQRSEEIGDEIVARFNPESGNIENLEILFFSKRLESQTQLELPLTAQLSKLRRYPIISLNSYLLYREWGIYDCSNLLNFGIFQELQNIHYFNQVKVIDGTVVWPHEQDICPDTLYLDSLRYKD
jgi:uncharacterized protein YuzE